MPIDNSNTDAALSPEKLDSTEDQSPKPWAVPMAKPAGGFQPEGTPLTFEPRPREVNKILNSKHVIEGMDLTDPDEAAVFVANFLSSKHNADKNEIYNDYELNTQVYGLSGTDPVADAKAILDGDTRTHQSAATLIAKRKKSMEPADSGAFGMATGLPRMAQESGGKGILATGQGAYAIGAEMTKELNKSLQRSSEDVGRLKEIEQELSRIGGEDLSTGSERMTGKIGRAAASSRGYEDLESQLVESRESGQSLESIQDEKRSALIAERDELEGAWKQRMGESTTRVIADEWDRLSELLRESGENLVFEDVPQDVRESLAGKYASGAGGMFQMILKAPIAPLLFTELYAHAENEERQVIEARGEVFDRSEGFDTRIMETAINTYVEKALGAERAIAGLIKTLGTRGGKVTVKQALKEIGIEGTKSAVGEVADETVQGTVSDFTRKLTYDPDYDMTLSSFVERRGMDALIAGPLGFFMGGGVRGLDLATRSDEFNMLDQLMDPVGGMSAVDMALAYNVIPEPEFNLYIEEQFGDQTTEEGVPLQELAKKARQGDRKAAEELVAATTVEASQAAVEAGLTPEEAEARGKEAAEVADPIEPLVETAIEKEISTKREELAALEEAEESTPESMKQYEKLDKEIQALETKRVEEIVKGKMMTPFTRGIEAERKRVEQARLDKADKELEEQDQVIDLINTLSPLSANTTVENMPELAAGGKAIIQGWKDAGFTKKEIEAKSKELMTAQGMPNTRLEDVVQKGSQKSTKTDGSPIQSLIKLFKGANPFTVVEEFAHAEYDRDIANGTVTVEQVREWRKAVEELTDTPDLRGETDEDIKEWVAEQVKARIYGQRNNLSLPESFLKFLDDIISGFKQILGRAKELQDLEASGQLPAGFLEMLDRQGLVGKPVGTPSTQGQSQAPTQSKLEYQAEQVGMTPQEYREAYPAVAEQLDKQTADETFSLEAVDANRAVAETVYLRNSQKFQDKLKSGAIRPQTPISAFVGKSVYFHAPDFAMAGTASVEGEQYAEGKGGVYYPVVFSDGTNFWASTRKAAEQMAKDLNSIGEKNDGKILMGLVTSPAEKMFSSTTMSRASVDFFNVIAKNPKKYGIKKADLNRLIVNASKAARDKDKAFTSKLKKSDNLGVNVKGIKEMMNPDDSTFGLRKSFVENLAAEVSEFMKTQSIESNTALAGALLGSDNLFAKNAIRKGKLSKASVMQGLGEQLSESFTKGLYDMGGEVNKKMVYAVIEYDGRVEAVESDQHESYPYAIRGIDGGEVIVNVLDKAHKLQDIVQYSEDVEFKKEGKVDSTAKAGESVSDTDMDRVMPPSAGITMKPLKVVEPKEGSVSTDLPSYSLEPIPDSEGGNLPPATWDHLFANGYDPSDAKGTQITTTKATYSKISAEIDKGEKVLDFAAGLGHGTKALADDGYDIDGYEPFTQPEKRAIDPTYEAASDIPSDSYDVVINNAVLNVVPEITRIEILQEIYRVLKPNGRAYMNLMGWNNIKGRLDNPKTKLVGPREVITGKGTFQKGYTQAEFVAFVKQVLPEAELGRSKFGDVKLLITKPADPTFSLDPLSEQDADYLSAVESNDMEAAQAMVDEQARMRGYNPLMRLFHGTKKRFDKLKSTRDPNGLIYFSTNKEMAQTYPRGIGGHRTPEADVQARIDNARLKSREYTNPAFEKLGAEYGNDIPMDLVDEVFAKEKEIQRSLLDGMTVSEADMGMGIRVIGGYIRAEDIFEPSNWREFKDVIMESIGVESEADILPQMMDAIESGNYIVWEKKAVVDAVLSKYDAMTIQETSGKPAETIAFRDPSQIKSSDPVTYDADGNVIPLSERFDPTRDEVNYSLEPLSEQDADAEATVAAEERQSRTPERQAFIDYQRELRRTQLDNTEEEKEKLQKLLQLATDADEIKALKQAGDEKIIRVVEQKVKQIRKQAAEREDVTESVKALERLINSPEVPMEVRARMRGYGRLAERTTVQGKARWLEQMANKLEAEIDRHYRTRNVRTLRSLLRPFATEYAPNRRKLRERVGEEARADLNFAHRLLNNGEATPPVGMTDERRDELIDIFGDVGNRQSNPTRVKAALDIAGSIAKGGRTARDDVKEDRRQRNEQVGDLVREEVLNGEEAMGKSQIAAREKQRGKLMRGFDYMRSRLIRGMEGFQQQLNKMDSVKGGVLESLFLPAVYQADQNEKALNREHVERVNEDFKTVLGADNRQAASWYKNSHELHDTDIEWIEDKAVGMEKRTISKQQGVALLMQWLDPSLRSTFSNMGINEATIEQVKEFIGEIGVSEAYYFRERYAEMGIRLNAKHMEVEGIPLDMIDGYGGRARRINSVGSRQEDMQMFSTNSAGRPTVKSGSMKERTNSTDYLIFQDAAMDFSAHAKEVNHYISHAELAKNLSAAFLNNARARNAITQKHGADFYESLKDQVEAIIEGDPKITNKTDRDWNRIRSNVTKAQLMAKPSILIKQLTSAPAFIEEIGPVAYAKAAASLTRNARKFMPMIWNSEYVKNRMSNSQFADIQQQLDQRDNTLKGLRWDDYAMMNVKWGDIGAVIAGGAPVYVHAYNEAKAAGMTNDQAQAKAEEVFGLASERAQQSSATHAKGAFLRGKGAARTWFMYLTSPLQYQRNVNTGIANLVANVFEKKAGRKSEVKTAANQALRAIVIYHVILPQIFQAVASGLVGFTDDEDYIKEQFWAKQRRALYAGNLNAIPLAGQLITVLANLAAGTGESWDSSGSPIIDLVGEIKQDFERAVKNGDDLSAWLELGSSAGLAAGIPVKTIKSYYEAITDISEGNTEHPLLRAGGWSKWSLFED